MIISINFGISIISHYLSDRITVWLELLIIHYTITIYPVEQKMPPHLRNIVVVLLSQFVYCRIELFPINSA